MSASPTSAICQRLEMDQSGTLYSMWGDDRTGVREVYLRRWDGLGWTGVGGSDRDAGLSGLSGGSARSGTYFTCGGNLAFDAQNRVYAAWMHHNGILSTYLRRWNFSTWEELATSASTNGVSGGYWSWWPIVLLDALDRPVVLWNANNGLFGQRWNGAAWVPFGSSMTSPGITGAQDAFTFSSTIARNGDLIVAWDDFRAGAGSYQVRLLTWNGSTWQPVGTSNGDGGISGAGHAERASIAQEVSGALVVGYDRLFPDGGVTLELRRWDGGTWALMPSPTFRGQHADLRSSQTGELYLTWEELVGSGSVIRLSQWNGVGWDPCLLGVTDTGRSSWPDLAVGPRGELAVSWSEEVAGVTQQWMVASLEGTDGGPDGGPDAGPDGGPDGGPDAGPDGGPDAGLDGSTDSGLGTDGGAPGPSPHYRVGCNCSAAAGGELAAAMVALAFALAKRRPGAPPSMEPT